MNGSQIFHKVAHLGVRKQVGLDQHSWWKIGGKAELFCEIRNIAQLSELLSILKETGVPFSVLGQGTNLLISDYGFRGCVIYFGKSFSSCIIKDMEMEVFCGAWVPAVAYKAAKIGLSGMEHTIGIPASFGGLTYMNGGSQRKSISSLISAVKILAENGEIKVLKKEDCGFSYRTSLFQNTNALILSTILSFEKKKPYAKQRPELINILASRRGKFPRKLPTCGSTFKSSPTLFEAYGPPGQIIEDLGFKGYRKGNIEVSRQHANFILNLGGGSSKDVLNIVSMIRKKVHEETGFLMEPEFRYLHESLGIIDAEDAVSY